MTTTTTKRAADFAETGEYIVTLPTGATHRIYRDTENGMWYEAGTGMHFSQAWLGFNKQDALSRLSGTLI